MRVFALKLLHLRLADRCHVLNAWRHTVGRFHFPVSSLPIIRNTGIRLVCRQHWYGDRVDELSSIAIVERNPCRMCYIDRNGEMERALCRTATKLEDNKLATAEVGAHIAIRDDAHALDAFRNTHCLIEHGAVGSDIHATNIVRGVGDIGYLYPCMMRSVFVNQTCLVVGHHLIEFDAGIHLSLHRQRGNSHEGTEYDSFDIHFKLVLLYSLL